jgi:hypothetical protein
MAVIRVPYWGLCLSEASYYGWRYGAHVGPWLVFWGRAEE